MSDFLLQLGQNPNARKVIKSLGLPIPMPQPLRRARGPMDERPLKDLTLVFGSVAGGAMTQVVADTVTAAGADPYVVGPDELLAPFGAPGEAFGRPANRLDLEQLPERFTADSLVFDATAVVEPAGLRGLYDFFHPLVKSLGKCGRIVVIGRSPAAATTAAASAASGALEGFVRSIAKEVGKKGSTAQLLYVDAGAEDRVPGILRFVLSPRSAYLSGQPIYVSATVHAVKAPWVHSMAGKVAMVTGAARGIGEATARLLAAEGAHVVCLDLPADDGPASKLAREIDGSVLLVDVSNPEAPARIAADLKARGGVDIVVHNAGITRDKTLARMKPEQWDQTIDINLDAILRINAALVADGALKDDARIICLSSVAGIAGNMGQTNYAASKSGLIGYVRKLAGELAPRGITVNAVAPGFIETRLTDAIPVMIREVGRRLSNLGQGGQPQDVGEVITFLATPHASGVTGNVVRVCGGALIGA